jgi:site-specific DNA recombinase
LFKRYASGTTTLSQLASWLNSEGFRTRNTKKLPDAEGNLAAGPRLFTVASVRGILHNSFYTSKVNIMTSFSQGAMSHLSQTASFILSRRL